jgi:hypothetical protein
MNTFVSWAEYNAGNSVAGFQSLRATANLTGIQSPGYMPEHMNGDRFLPGERSVPHQLFSSVGVLVPAVRGLLGVSVKVTPSSSSMSAVIDFHPRVPAGWPSFRFSNVALAGGMMSGEVRRDRQATVVNLSSQAPHIPARVRVAIPIPLAARVRRVTLDGRPAKFELRHNGDTDAAFIETQLVPHLEAVVEYDGGIEIVPPTIDPAPGERSSSLKIIRTSLVDDHHLDVSVAGLGGCTYTLEFVSQFPQLTADGVKITKTPTGFRAEIPFEDTGYSTRLLHISF